MNKDFRSILEPVFTHGQSSEPVNIVFYLIFPLPPLLFSSLSTLSHHLSYHSISSPEGPVFAKRPRSWQGLALPLLALLYFCLSRLFPLSSYFYLFPAFISLTPGSARAGGAQLPEQYELITQNEGEQEETRWGKTEERNKEGGPKRGDPK